MAIKNILIAENEAIIALDILTTLTANSYSVVGPARTYNGVVRRIKQSNPDLLISSMLLDRDKNYFDNIVKLQKEYKFNVLFLAGVSDLSSYISRCDGNCFKFLKKPFDSESFLSTINNFQVKTIQ